ncbi:hypothetical protein HPP92_012400 [Vanilla planifolia]|uniref:tRNA(Phe) 7-[(3-amino-3-carboxypropyl)-4-demethylwyosine(37)-N(4)]-methyltransferase n=1 Tax=Vanilla planifolia TaxID=51239 RepID=A0A835R8X2_VANPL|nr:hypothetical protein HPP92_012400 [Vanilla planifolia]
MDFERRKAKTLASLAAPWSDKSPKGSIDAPIASLLSVINLHPSFFTTSSCSGRISVLRQPCERHNYDSKEENKILTKKSKKKAGGGAFPTFGENETVGEEGGILVFRFEPLIIAVDCKDVASAQELVSTAIACGFRESEVPLGQIGLIMVTPEYVRYLITVANEKMEANRQRTDGFLHVLQEKIQK